MMFQMRKLFSICFMLAVAYCNNKLNLGIIAKRNEVANFACLVLGLCSTPAFSGFTRDKFTTVYQWKYLEYLFDSPYQKQAFINNGSLIPNKPAPIDVDVWYGPYGQKKVFVTIPRFQNGVPIALGTVEMRNNEPHIKPYPSMEWFSEPTRCNPKRIVSVYRVMIDECDRLWVVDYGQLDAEVICPPQIMAFDLKTDQLLYRYEIPRSQYQPLSTLLTPMVDVISKENRCKNTFVYVADCQAFALIVYDLKNQKSWRLQHYTMYPDPDFGVYDIAGESFTLMDGILGMALSPRSSQGSRKLFYHAMSSDTEHWIYTKDLQNETLASNPDTAIHTYYGRRGTQSAAEAIDAEGIMYFGLMHDIKIACFDTRGQYGLNYSSTDIVANNYQTLQFPSGMKVINNPQGIQELWVVTSRFQKVANDNIKNNEYNFRILAAPVEDLKRGTRCQCTKTNPWDDGAIVFPSNE